ncbi:bifunctional DNA primase/polymerase [Methylobacterium nodulans]|uniref:Bifunctional DNA primase/polymerase n=1 Tax=Methylobacterium nodulans (strain LMG 21967 / CNCM I-2342 / ORS 2060) TaxID=460265 RepID=B8ITQ1_METNO|nr:bifunctional DNA primase/polymerase [Methylobacterium nodulans]ACL58967.1 Bifunctional DNA primase/polymerase [Methylobacterium nodulans ORS 2060]
MTAPTDNPLLLAALDYATRGWPVFPCSPTTKQPLTRKESAPGAKDGGLHLATTDEDQIRAWWTKHPRAMIGIPTGARTGNVLDLDLGDPAVITGAAYLERLREHVGGIPETAIAETGSGGLHLWFRADPDAPIANGANICPALFIPPTEGATRADGRKAKGAAIDVRGEGGYVIVPPSVREDGRAYTWCPGPEDGLSPPTEALLRLMRKEEARAARDAQTEAASRGPWAPRPADGSDPARSLAEGDEAVVRYGRAALDKEIAAVAAAPSGGRNNALNAAALKLGGLVAAGALVESEVREALRSAAEACGLVGDDGLKSVLDTIDSGLRAGLRRPRDLSEVWARAARDERRRQRRAGGSGADQADAAADESCGDAEIDRIAALYPLPRLASPPLFYERHRGRVMVHKEVPAKRRDAAAATVAVPVATPFGMTARIRYLDREDAYGLRIAVEDMSGRPRYIDIERGDLARQGAGEIRALLFAAGLRTEDDGEHIAVRALKAADPKAEILVVSQPGWHELPDLADPFFVCPGGEVIGTPEGSAYELSVSTRMPPSVAASGSLPGWTDAVEAAINVEACEHWTLGACAAFAGPLVSLTGLDTCGLNLSGLSSSGKSTAQKIAVSAWSTPDIRKPGLAQSAKSTVNAMEALAARSSGTVLSLDELAHVTGAEVARMIYTFAGGVGRRRMTADATLRESYTWSTFAILSAECSLEEKVKTDERAEWVAGMAARFADVDVTSVNRSVDRPTLDRIAAIERNFGHAGPAFVRALVADGAHRDPVALRERIMADVKRIAGTAADSTQMRAAIPFALLRRAGELAVSYRLLPAETPVAAAVAWAWNQFMHSSDARALDPEEQVVANLRAWVVQRWNVTLREVGASGGGPREAEGWFDEDAVYVLREKLRAAAGNVMTEEATAGVLRRNALLFKEEKDGRPYLRYVRGLGKVQAYALKRPDFGREVFTNIVDYPGQGRFAS